MRKTFAILLFGALPALAYGAGNHSGGHDMHGGHDMGQMKRDGHDMSGMSQMHNTGAGRPGDPAKVSRTIEVTMDDNMRFTPNRIEVKAGETVRFFVRNTGKLQHEFVLGSMAELKEHAAMMRAMPDMKHAEPNMVTLAGGKLGGLVWQFDQAGTVDFACLLPGHLEAGMAGKIKVE
ncbi:hypothetical protein SVA_3159 [Sulfurifustis variabilis]|uniref:Blue (type 1) copper domain-containing protein n=1 Tax=Sulfurifustis variabilis TaxID=1675686 RepID=A0A1B4VG04_9GAMM|nr:cupredoxin family protein [Sulfurifustis variabilis]BAU49707.1 hypothetical protein SVA_3159 [Sulfurifustis variabilis]